MTEELKVWIGVDPGGKDNFGLAIMKADGSSHTWCVDHADAAIDIVRTYLSSTPAGAGVDAPLWWSSGRSSDRHADRWLRTRYGFTSGQVQTSNSLRGAALVQAAMFVQRLREAYPAVPVTEVHPKALLRAIAENSWEIFSSRYQVNSTHATEHERDSIVAAVAAREGFEGRWTHDLASKRLPSEQDPRSYWLAPIYYYWPEQ